MTQNDSGPPRQPSSMPPIQPRPPEPPTLPYRAPRDEPPRNTPGLFFLRALAGLGIGVVALVIGGFLYHSTNNPAMIFVPLGVALVGTLVYSIRNHRFGYTTGILTGLIVAPIILIGIAAAFLLIICGGFKT